MAQGIKTPPEKVAEVKAMLDMGHSQQQTADNLSVAKGTVNRVAAGELVPATELLDLIKSNHEDFLTAILSRMGERLEKELDTGTPTGIRSMALSYAIMYDKRALTRGEPTQIAAGMDKMGDQELRKRAEELMGGQPMQPDGPTDTIDTPKAAPDGMVTIRHRRVGIT